MTNVSLTDASTRSEQIDGARTEAEAGNLEPLRELKAAYDGLHAKKMLEGEYYQVGMSAVSVMLLWRKYVLGLTD